MPCCFSFQSQSGSPWSAFPVLFHMITLICKMFSFCLSFLPVWGENPLSFQFLFTRPHFHFCYFSVISHQVYRIVLWHTGLVLQEVSEVCSVLYICKGIMMLSVVFPSSPPCFCNTWMLLDFLGGDHELLVHCLQWYLHFPAKPGYYIDFNCKINFTFILCCVLLHMYQWYLQLI